MKPKLVVVVDTEEDWMSGKVESPSVSNIFEIPKLQKKYFDPLNIKPTYLLTYPVATNSELIRIFKGINQRGACEIGTHVHNWTSPPFTDDDVKRLTYHTNLPYHLERKKILDLTEIIKTELGIVPQSFKGGRWGANGRTIKILEELEYKVDTSVCPLTDYTPYGGGPNFFFAPFEPYFPSYENILKKVENVDTKNAVLELPVTIGFGCKNFEAQGKWLAKLQQKSWIKGIHFIGFLHRLNLLRRIKLSQETATYEEMKQLVDISLKRKQKLFYLTFHSNILKVGTSPYSRTEEERDRRLMRLSKILQYLRRDKEIESQTAIEFRNYYLKYSN